jgi:hypothetical protein
MNAKMPRADEAKLPNTPAWDLTGKPLEFKSPRQRYLRIRAILGWCL